MIIKMTSITKKQKYSKMDPNKIESGIKSNIPLKVSNTVSVINDFTLSISTYTLSKNGNSILL